MDVLAAALLLLVVPDPFAARLWRALPPTTGNVVLSPTGARACLGLLAPALGPSSRAALARTLGVATPDLDAEARRAAAALKRMEQGGEMASANAGFFADPTSPVYAKAMRDDFGGAVEALPHGDEGVRRINGWASERTKGRISTIIERLTPADRMVLVNAITFDAAWEDRFEARETEPMPFTTPGGKRMMPTMHHLHLTMAYAKGPDFRLVALPYDGERFQMVVLLPDQGDPARLLRDGAWTRALEKAQRTWIGLALPRFTLHVQPMVKPALKAMGLAPLFERADLRPAVPSGTIRALGDVVQKSFIEVAEDGTKAGVVTAIRGVGETRPVRRPLLFVVDHPFAFVVQNVATGEALFEGVVREP